MIAHWDYVLRWSLWLHHPWLAAILTVLFVSGVGIWAWRSR